MQLTRRGALGGAALALALSPARAQSAIGGPFSLTGGAGQSITSDNFPGKFLLIFFGYTHCPDECPATMYQLARALAEMGAAARRLQCLFITIDPARDTPAIASRYADLFSPDIIGLSGTPAQVAQAMQAYHVYAAPAGPQGGEITHSDFIYLMAPNGSFITAYPGNLPAKTLAARITPAMGGA
ncbi:hypothetical protein GCM10010909_13310 [Acidocella aquatica]|uniref:Protein SCO1/2 n=1 Tax=Acidocella aquatica TaxID=1922313 RepID=A0ABQ6A2I0_9PROT|nr:SCO family protein [Acidocella aquatica]GLR66651.1 hypothetical protein GCM10010909_13310 [Acidocella aquatica]